MFGTCGVLRGLYVYFYYVSVCYDTKICLSMVVSFLGGRLDLIMHYIVKTALTQHASI